MSHAVLAHVVRSGFVESVHHGAAVALDGDGQLIFAAGMPNWPIFPRSANKLPQAVGLVEAGVGFEGAPLALIAASHSGEAYHRDGVRRLLATAGLDESALQNAPDLPLGPAERLIWQRLGRRPNRVAQNCSGKHAGMLIACVENDWPLAGYLAPEHPLQRHLYDTTMHLAREEPAAVGVDGCGAPVLAISLTGLARAFSSIAGAEPGTPQARVAHAVREHPEWLGGTGRDVTEVLRGVPGLIAKDGAEGVYAAAMPNGRAVALKIADGSERARRAVLAALLRRVGVDAPVLDEFMISPVLGGGEPVGMIEVVGI